MVPIVIKLPFAVGEIDFVTGYYSRISLLLSLIVVIRRAESRVNLTFLMAKYYFFFPK